MDSFYLDKRHLQGFTFPGAYQMLESKMVVLISGWTEFGLWGTKAREISTQAPVINKLMYYTVTFGTQNFRGNVEKRKGWS